MNKLNVTDLDLNFTMHPFTGDVSIKTGEDAIKQSLKNLLLISTLEKPFSTQFNLNIKEYLFLNFSVLYAQDLKQQMLSLIDLYEKRVKINNIDISYPEDQNQLNIIIDFSVIGEEQKSTTLNLVVERDR
jgi:phage baseplate assembly protein W